MGSRRRARELALKLLYLMDVGRQTPEECLPLFWEGQNARAEVRAFAERIAYGVAGNRAEIDGLISSHTFHWKLDRIAAVDRNILRLALWELLHEPETPRAVVINEAIEIAKRFSTDDSSQFINGVLDGIRRVLDREEPHAAGPVREPATDLPPDGEDEEPDEATPPGEPPEGKDPP